MRKLTTKRLEEIKKINLFAVTHPRAEPTYAYVDKVFIYPELFKNLQKGDFICDIRFFYDKDGGKSIEKLKTDFDEDLVLWYLGKEYYRSGDITVFAALINRDTMHEILHEQ